VKSRPGVGSTFSFTLPIKGGSGLEVSSSKLDQLLGT
jgi:hypothetical protein